MDHNNLTLTDVDRLILDSYVGMLDGLANYLGEGYEIVLHSLEDLDRSVIKIVNGHHTGRKVGAPITDLALAMLSRISQKEGATSISYFTQNKNGEPLKASTIAIKGENQRIIGLLCMNFYLNTPLAQALGAMLPPSASNVGVTETFGESSSELVRQAVCQVRGQVEADPTVPPSLKKRQMVSLLYSKGIFNIKNSVDQVAKYMEISKNTVYLHLRYIKEKEG